MVRHRTYDLDAASAILAGPPTVKQLRNAP